MCVCVCVCVQPGTIHEHTHIFWGAAAAIFSQFADTKNFVALAALLMWIRIPFLNFAPSPFPVQLPPGVIYYFNCIAREMHFAHCISLLPAFVFASRLSSLPFPLYLCLPLSAPIPHSPYLPTDLLLPFAQTVARCEVCFTILTHTLRLVVHSHWVKWSLQGVYRGFAVETFSV